MPCNDRDCEYHREEFGDSRPVFYGWFYFYIARRTISEFIQLVKVARSSSLCLKSLTTNLQPDTGATVTLNMQCVLLRDTRELHAGTRFRRTPMSREISDSYLSSSIGHCDQVVFWLLFRGV